MYPFNPVRAGWTETEAPRQKGWLKQMAVRRFMGSGQKNGTVKKRSMSLGTAPGCLNMPH